MFVLCCFILTATAFLACNDDSDPAVDGDTEVETTEDGDDEEEQTEEDTADEDIAMDQEPDPEPEAEPEEEINPNAKYCEELGLPIREFSEENVGSTLYATAENFTIPTRKGDWEFAREWSGCENYLFIQDMPKQARDWPDDLWDRDVDDLLNAIPDNTHVFFCSNIYNADNRTAALDAIDVEVQTNLLMKTPEEREDLERRIHIATWNCTSMDNVIGDINETVGWGIGIDRFQRIRYIGSYADPGRYNAAKQWFAPNLSMAANEAKYYNFEYEREERLLAQDATVLPVFTGEVLKDPGWAGEKGYAEVTFPDADTMAGFDSMELDLYLGCDGDGEYGTCPAWDYLVHMYICDKEEPDTCNVEFGRWITTYHREGRWVHDVSAMMPLVKDGGTRRFAFYTQQPYEVKLSIRLFNSSKDARPEESHFLFSGGGFGPEYNDKYEPITIAIPSDAVKVELASVITGHGMESPGNCAEFCNTTHHFTVNDTETVIDFPWIGDDLGCMKQVSEGTVPNQYGTWWYGRSGWCPGKEAPITLTDVTDMVTPGQDAVIEYHGLFNGQPYPNGGARIDMKSWLVISR